MTTKHLLWFGKFPTYPFIPNLPLIIVREMFHPGSSFQAYPVYPPSIPDLGVRNQLNGGK